MTATAIRKSSWKKRAFSWALALAALAFVAWVVPIRDRCEDMSSPAGTTRVPVTRTAGGGCILHVPSGDVPYEAAYCDTLKCEPGLASTFSHARLDLLAILLVAYFAGTVAWAARWRILLALAGVRMTLFDCWRVTIQAQAGGILLPGGLGGDALRIASLVGRGAKAPIAIASTLLDRVLGLVTIASLAAAFGLSLAGSSGALARVTVLSYALAAFPVGLLVGLLVLRSRWVRAMAARLDVETPGMKGKLVRLFKPILAYVGDPKAPRAIVLGLLMSLVVSAIQLGIIRGCVLALGAVPSEEKWVYVGSAVAMIVAAVPALPGGWGTADAAYVFFLGEQAGLGAGVALAVCLLYRLFWYLSGVLGAIMYFVSGARRVAPENEPPRSEEENPS